MWHLQDTKRLKGGANHLIYLYFSLLQRGCLADLLEDGPSIACLELWNHKNLFRRLQTTEKILFILLEQKQTISALKLPVT